MQTCPKCWEKVMWGSCGCIPATLKLTRTQILQERLKQTRAQVAHYEEDLAHLKIKAIRTVKELKELKD